MKKTLLSEEEIREIEKEFVIVSLIENYLQNSNSRDREFKSIRRAEELSLFDEMEPIRNIVLMQDKSGKTIVLKQFYKNYSFSDLQDVTEKYGFTDDDIISLLQTGLSLKEIDQIAELCIGQNANPIELFDKIIRYIEPQRREMLEKKGILVGELNDGTIRVEILQRIAEVDEKGVVRFEPELFNSIERYVRAGIIKANFSDNFYIKENEPMQDQGTTGSSLELVSAEEKDKDRQNVQKIAADLNMDSDEIVSIIRIDDNENGSKLLNNAIGKDSTKYIIRTRDGIAQNKFIVAEERNGKYEQSQGFEFTPVAKEVASLLKDTQGRNGYCCYKTWRN